MALGDQVVKERCNLVGADPAGMPLPVKQDEAPDPVDIRVFSKPAGVFAPDGIRRAVDEVIFQFYRIESKFVDLLESSAS